MELEKYLKRRNAAFAYADAEQVVFDPSFRALCERNACGYYGKCWVCPPDVGPVGELIEKAKSYRRVLVFQSVHKTEDSFDIEGMHKAAVRHNRLARGVRKTLQKNGHADCLILGAGACGGCRTCAKQKGEPCRSPEKAVISLEACGVDAAALVKLAGLQNDNGENTVVYIGAAFFN